MSWVKWIPWKGAARRLARQYGFIDPIAFLDRLRQFARPSEVGEPIELLRAGVVFHARGLINRAIQFNLDWVWPYWVERQFNPADESFVPRAFSFSHINLTHRNWTAVGLPGCDHYPIVDPRGLVTPWFDGWSLDFWIVDEYGAPLLLPSRAHDCEQRLELQDNLHVITAVRAGENAITSTVWLEPGDPEPVCVIRLEARARSGAKLIVSARPYNPEGISFIDSIRTDESGWVINDRQQITFSARPERWVMSCFENGDVLTAVAKTGGAAPSMACPAGMATAAAVFPVERSLELRGNNRTTASSRPTTRTGNSKPKAATRTGGNTSGAQNKWAEELARCVPLKLSDPQFQSLYDTAVATLILHSPHTVFPGPYTYKRFWYRDAAFILNALLTIGAHERVRRALELFPRGQTDDGYFRSQEGEWDANGEVLWILDRYYTVTGETVSADWLERIERGARWIIKKRMPAGSRHPGLLPAGFSAEHLGPNDYYYWDDFWGVAGLRSAARLLISSRPAAARDFNAAADEFMETIVRSFPLERTGGAIPAAPDRRMDSGAVGSLVADYPLELLPAGDPRMMKTVEWLLEHSFYRGGFFQNMIHSGINVYLTLHVAQVLLRAGDSRAQEMARAVANLASATGQWPEAIHPRTLGGCMGDGQHVWAAAEWVMYCHAAATPKDVR